MIGLSLAGLCAAGCERTMVAQPLDPAVMAGTPDAAMEFWHSLPGRSAVTNSEGLHGVLLLADGTDTSEGYDARVATLKQRGWLESGFDEPENMAMQRGTLAKALVHMMDVRGGVMMHLTGRSPRYAARELAYMGVIQPETTSNQVMSGLDYLAVISKSQDYMTTEATKAQAKAAGEALKKQMNEAAEQGGTAPVPQPAPADPQQPAAQPSGS
jgi:hypothetical protein